MGASVVKAGLADEPMGMTDREKKLVRSSWQRFCDVNHNYGMLLFMGMFTKHPDYLNLFKQFRGRDLRSLHIDHKFRAHASAVGHQLSAMIECLDDPEVLIVLIQKNALSHTTRNVKPANFEGLFEAVIEEMTASEKSLMKTATVTAWEKLFETVNLITRCVYDEVAASSGAAVSSNLRQNETPSSTKPKKRISIATAGPRPLAISSPIYDPDENPPEAPKETPTKDDAARKDSKAHRRKSSSHIKRE
ncbi:globin-like [Dermacentor andersoni]|uniref:globin-like n=1 Tax=Dermacentor andersoni TaxID=34620 RepID=UPI003B3A3AD5